MAQRSLVCAGKIFIYNEFNVYLEYSLKCGVFTSQ